MLRLPCEGGAEQSTTNTIYAAAFATLGMSVKTHRAHDLSTGDDGMSYTISAESLSNPALQTASLHWGLLRGTLAKADPLHPVLDAVGTLRNRAAILRWIKRAHPYRLHVHGQRAAYVEGAEQSTLIPEVKTDDLHLVAALGRLGVPLVKFTGTAPHHIFWLPAIGLDMAGYQCNVVKTISTLRNGSLEREEPQHPLHGCLLACRAYDALKKLMHAEPTMLTLHDTKWKSGWQATLREDSTHAAYDSSRALFAQKSKL